MKKLILIVFLIVSLIGCRDTFNGSGIIIDKGIDYVNIKVMLDNFDVRYCDKEKNVIDMYWIKLNTCKDKIYINLFSWEDCEKGQFIILGPEHSDNRFESEY
jgi:hypothetical protein